MAASSVERYKSISPTIFLGVALRHLHFLLLTQPIFAPIQQVIDVIGLQAEFGHLPNCPDPSFLGAVVFPRTPVTVSPELLKDLKDLSALDELDPLQWRAPCAVVLSLVICSLWNRHLGSNEYSKIFLLASLHNCVL